MVSVARLGASVRCNHEDPDSRRRPGRPHRGVQPGAGSRPTRSPVVDVNEPALRDLQDRIDMRAVAGNASHPSVLEAAGIADTDILIALTNSDEVNIVACQIAQLLYRTPTRIARIRAAEYTSRPQLFADEGARGRRVDQSRRSWSPTTSCTCCPTPARCRSSISPTAGCSWPACARSATGCWSASRCATLREHLPERDVRVAAIYRDGALRPTATP